MLQFWVCFTLVLCWAFTSFVFVFVSVVGDRIERVREESVNSTYHFNYQCNQLNQMPNGHTVDALSQLLHAILLFGFFIFLSVQPEPWDRVCDTQIGIAVGGCGGWDEVWDGIGDSPRFGTGFWDWDQCGAWDGLGTGFRDRVWDGIGHKATNRNWGEVWDQGLGT